ncbi:MAG: substrate-binding domain-containing protein [Pelobacteraceae bacterium]
MKRILISLCAMLLLFSSSAASAEEIRIATGHTFIKRVFDPIRSAFKDKTGLELKIAFNDPLPALAELEKGNADVAGASLMVDNWLELGKAAGIPVKERSMYSSVVVVTEKSHFVVNKANRVQTLSKEQLKGIFTGTLTNWTEVGGDDAPILIVWPTVSSGSVIIVKQKVMDNEPLTKTVYDVETIGEVPDAVASTPEAIGVVTGISVEDGLKEVAPPIERPLTLLYKGTASPNLQKLLNFLTVEGKQYIQ